MSNIIDNEDNSKQSVNRVDDMASMTPAGPTSRSIKPPIPNPNVTRPEAQALIDAVQDQQAAFRASAAQTKDVKSGVATLENLNVRTPGKLDFSQITEDDIYNLDIPIEARPFESEDSLRVNLLDSGYAARWVNKEPRRLGSMMAKGFSYVTEQDLADTLHIATYKDVEGHFANGDVILMKCPKERYFPALKAAHLRAMAAVGNKESHRRALAVANDFMSKEVGGAYKEEAEANKVAFYTPGVTV